VAFVVTLLYTPRWGAWFECCAGKVLRGVCEVAIAGQARSHTVSVQ